MVRGQAFKGVVLAAEITVVLIGDTAKAFGQIRGISADNRYRITIRDRQRLQEQSVGETKNCCIHSNAKREGNNGDSGKAGGMAEYPQSVAQILNEVFDQRDPAGVATFFFQVLKAALRHFAEGALRGE